MLLSGFYEQDVEIIESECLKYGLMEVSRLVSESGWTALRMKKTGIADIRLLYCAINNI